jgi:hypothetical protein
MTRILILMFAITVAASTGAEAAPRKSAKAEAWQTAAVAAHPTTPARASVGQPQRLFH